MEPRPVIGGRYRLGAPLGSGGMAQVRDGWDLRLDRPVAVKLMQPHFLAKPDMKHRFRDEALAAASLNHPNIVSVFDSGEHDGVPFIIMERLPGSSLADEIATGPLSSARLRDVLVDILSAVDTAHRAGILHRDIKPGNILHAVSGPAVKLADFGIAKALRTGTHTRAGEMLGTMPYLSPERIAGAPASTADDLYAVGVVGFEALTGRPRFERDSDAALAHAIMTEHAPPLSTLRPDADRRLTALIDQATAPDPGVRCADAAGMLAALQASAGPIRTHTRVLEAPPPHQPVSLAYVPPLKSGGRRRTTILAAIGAGLITVASTAITVAAVNSPATPSTPATPSVPSTPPTPASAPQPAPAVSSPAPRSVPDLGDGRGNGKARADGNGKGPKKRAG